MRVWSEENSKSVDHQSRRRPRGRRILRMREGKVVGFTGREYDHLRRGCEEEESEVVELWIVYVKI